MLIWSFLMFVLFTLGNGIFVLNDTILFYLEGLWAHITSEKRNQSDKCKCRENAVKILKHEMSNCSCFLKMN